MDLSKYNKPIGSISAKPSQFFGNMSARASSTSQMVLSHQMGLEAAHYGNELNKDLASHQGGIASALSAQGHEQASSLSAQEHNQRHKEDGANRRHEIKKIVLGHNNDLEKLAVDHHLSTGKLRTESSLRVREAGVAHKHAADLLSRVASAGEGGTPVSITSGKASASFTLKNTVAPTAPAAPAAPKKMIHVTPVTRTAAPAPEPKPAFIPKMVQGTGGKFIKNPDHPDNKGTATEPATKKPSTKKASVKGQPTVTRDKRTGRMIGSKKK